MWAATSHPTSLPFHHGWLNAFKPWSKINVSLLKLPLSQYLSQWWEEKKKQLTPGLWKKEGKLMRVFNLKTEEAEAGRTLSVWGQPDLQIESTVASAITRKNTISKQTNQKNLIDFTENVLFNYCSVCPFLVFWNKNWYSKQRHWRSPFRLS